MNGLRAPSESEVVGLGIQARVKYAANCARRAILGFPNWSDHETTLAPVEIAIRAAEAAAQSLPANQDGVEALRSAAVGAHAASESLRANGANRGAACAEAAARAASSAYHAARGENDATANAAWRAGVECAKAGISVEEVRALLAQKDSE